MHYNGERGYSRKSQCRRQPSQSKMAENDVMHKKENNILTISPTLLEQPKKTNKGGVSVKRDSMKYSNYDYESITSLNKSEIDNSKSGSNKKIQIKNLNFLLRPNSVLHASSSPNSLAGNNNSIINDSEYPLPSIPGHIEDRLQNTPLRHSRSNSRLKNMQNQA